jgi:signal transduction histidine kinase
MAMLLAEPHDLDDWADLSQYTHQPLLCAGQWTGGLLVQASAPPRAADAWTALAGAMAMALAGVQSRSCAVRLSEHLAGASQVLAATGDALAQAKTLAAVAEMAAGAAHELNNPLAVISGRAQLMAGRAGSEDERRAWELITEQAQRISDIISELMEFASPAEPSPQEIDARDLLTSAAGTFAAGDHAQARTARVDIDVGPDVPALWADRRQVQTVLAELIRNAATAVQPSGQIRLRAQGQAGQVLLTVEDRGGGMDERTLANAFTPFFSSQRAGRRRGLGLARSRRYVEINGGSIRISSQPGRGTSVLVLLPAATNAQERTSAHDQP